MDMHAQINARRDGAKFKHRHDEDQGFVDQRGVYMTREEAFGVAWQAGQIFDLAACGRTVTDGGEACKLYSEGLY
jgi:hypothetical protein